MIRLFVSYSGLDADGNEFQSNGFYDVEQMPRDKDALNKLSHAIMARDALKGFNAVACVVLFFQQV